MAKILKNLVILNELRSTEPWGLNTANTEAEFLPSRLLFIFKCLVVNSQRISGYSRQICLDRPWIISLGKT